MSVSSKKEKLSSNNLHPAGTRLSFAHTDHPDLPSIPSAVLDGGTNHLHPDAHLPPEVIMLNYAVQAVFTINGQKFKIIRSSITECTSVLSQPNNNHNHNPNSKTTKTVVRLRLSNAWEYNQPPPTTKQTKTS